MKRKIKTIEYKNVAEFKKALRELKTMPRTANRDISAAHVTTMCMAITLNGVRRAIQVVESDEFGEGKQLYILDGQHLRQAILDTPDEFIWGVLQIWVESGVSSEEAVLTVADLNTNQKNWKLSDHYKSMVKLSQMNPKKFKSYGLLADKVSENQLELVGLIEAYDNSNDVSHLDFKRGKYSINELQGNKIVSIYQEAIKCGLNANASSFRAIVRTVKCYPDVKVNNLLKGISDNPNFSDKFSRDRYMSMLTSIKKIR